MDGSWQEEVRKKRIDTLFSLLYFSLECQPICHNPISPDISMLKMINTITTCFVSEVILLKDRIIGINSGGATCCVGV